MPIPQSYKKSQGLITDTSSLFTVKSPSPLFSLSPLKYDLGPEVIEIIHRWAGGAVLFYTGLKLPHLI